MEQFLDFLTYDMEEFGAVESGKGLKKGLHL